MHEYTFMADKLDDGLSGFELYVFDDDRQGPPPPVYVNHGLANDSYWDNNTLSLNIPINRAGRFVAIQRKSTSSKVKHPLALCEVEIFSEGKLLWIYG